MERRAFLKGSALATAAGLSGGMVSEVLGKSTALAAGPGNKWPGRVVINFNKSAATMTSLTDGAVIEGIASSMVIASIKSLTGLTDVGAAWKSIFPSTLSVTSKIAIKPAVGCAIKIMGPHYSVIRAIIDGLLLMDFNGAKIPASNITVYNMRCSNRFNFYDYSNPAKPLPSPKQATLGNVLFADEDSDGTVNGARQQKYARSLLNADFLINVFRLGSHDSGDTKFSGRTLGFKNHFGTYPPNINAEFGHAAVGSQKYLRDINGTDAVFNKNVLSVCAGLFGANEDSGGPGSDAASYRTYARTMDASIAVTGTDNIAPNTIIMSTDPVTAEMQAIKIMKLNKSLPYATANMPPYLRESAGINCNLDTAKGPLNFGVIDETQMDIRIIKNGTPTEAHTPQQKTVASSEKLRASYLKGQNSVFIEFALPEHLTGTTADIKIFDIKGSLVHSSSQQILGIVNHMTWNMQSHSGGRASQGMYIVKLFAGSVQRSASLMIS